MSIAYISGHMPHYNTQLMEESSFEYIFLVEVHLYKLINKSNTLSILEPLPTLIFSGKGAMKNPTSIGHTTLHIEMLTSPPSHLPSIRFYFAGLIYVSATSKQL